MYKFTHVDNLYNFAVQNTKNNLAKYHTIREKKTSLCFWNLLKNTLPRKQKRLHQTPRFYFNHRRSFCARGQSSNSSVDLGGENPNENWPGTRKWRRKHLITLREMAHHRYNFWKLIEFIRTNCFKDNNWYFLVWRRWEFVRYNN